MRINAKSRLIASKSIDDDLRDCYDFFDGLLPEIEDKISNTKEMIKYFKDEQLNSSAYNAMQLSREMRNIYKRIEVVLETLEELNSY